MKAIKFLLGLGLMVASSSVFSQGLEGIVVEKYYQAQAADLSAANANIEPGAPALTTNSVTYRVYADLATGYKVNAIYGDLAHPANFTTTTGFYNHNAGADVLSSTSTANQILQNSRLLDSYLTIGAVCTGKVGVIEAEDNDGALTHATGLLQNNPGGTCFGSPIFGTNAKDGLVASSGTTFATVSAVGLGGTILDALGANGGSVVSFNDGSYYTQNGIVGPASSTTNKVLIGQFTTDGEFSFAMNIQVGLATGGGVQYYVSSNPTGSELTLPSLTLAPNAAPTVSVAGTIVSSGAAAGANIINGTAMKFTATAADNVSVTDVKFYDGATLLSTDATAPYEHLYTAVQGSHTITAVATDDQCVTTTSTAYSFTSAPNQAPVVTVTVPANPTTTVEGNVITFTATATDVDGSVAGVQFYLNNVAVGSVDNSSPYQYTYTAVLGSGQLIKAVATDDLGLTGTSSNTTLNVLANVPASVSMTGPSASGTYNSYVSAAAAAAVTPTAQSLTPMTFTATAADSDGTVSSMNFYLNGVLLGAGTLTSGTTSNGTYSYTWNSLSGTQVITAKATDSNGAETTSATLTVVINDLLALPYEVKDVTQLCNLPTFCVPVGVSSTYTVDNVKGYDVVMTYDATKVAPVVNANTGYNVTVFNALNVTASIVDVSAAIQTPGTLNIALYFNGSAPASAEWNGTNANIFCVEFARIAPASPTAPGFQPFEESTVAISFLQESRITGVIEKPVTAGQMISTTEQNYVATIDYWSGNGDIAYDVASPNTYLITNIQGVFGNGTETSVNPVVPNVTGQFTHVLNTLVGGVRTAVPNIAIKRDVNNINSVLLIVNSSDAVIAKTILLNQPLQGGVNPSVYQMIACDVNRDGVLSAGDVSQMQQRTVGILQEYLQVGFYNADGTPIANAGPSKDWLFIDPASLATAPYTISATFPFNDGVGYSKADVPVVPFYLPTNVQNYTANDASCPTVGTAAYKGVMLGDANGSYATYTADGVLKGNEADYILVDLGNVIVEGTKVSVPVSIVSEELVNAFDLALGLNENTLSYVSMEDTQLGSSSAAFYNENDKTFRHTSFNVNNFSANARVAFFTFETVDGTISEKDFTSELALLNDKSVEVRFTKSADLVTNSVDIYPNPSNGMFTVTSKVDGRVDIVDVTGKLVHPGVIVKANQMIEVNMPELSAGVYFVRMYSNNSMTTERIVISE
jgi:hypothetical protein